MSFFESLGNALESVIFFNILFFTDYTMPICIFVILCATVYFSIKLNFINFTKFFRAGSIFFEKEEEKDGSKAVTSKAAFLSAISGCVGIGSISGVAAALYAGGPGAVFWMLVAGFLVMPVRYAEVFLGHFFRTKEKNGVITNYGPYAYIKNGLRSIGFSNKVSKFLFVFYVVAMLLGSTGAILMQANPLSEIAGYLILDNSKNSMIIFSVVLSGISFFVIIGGLKRMVHTMEKTVSTMSIIYIVSILLILFLNFKNIPAVFSLILSSAFDVKSAFGGILGIIIVSFTRVIVSTEVGLGTVSFLHGKSQNPDSVREGLLSMVGPFVVNFVFISLNSIAVLASVGAGDTENGILKISNMFASVHPYFSFVLLIIAFLFGFTTIIAWYFYAESSLNQISQSKYVHFVYKAIFFIIIAISGMFSFDAVIKIIDSVVLSMVFPNIICLFLLGGVVAREYKKYKNIKK